MSICDTTMEMKQYVTVELVILANKKADKKNRKPRWRTDWKTIETAIILESSLTFSVSSITLVGPLGGVWM